jgi:PPOX class probable F420-dependent enzyme
MSDPWNLFGTTRTAVLTTQKRDGRPQLSNIGYQWDPATRVALISVTDTRAKTRNLRRDPRASLYVTTSDLGAYAVGEGDAELTAVSAAPDDDVVNQLVEYYRALAGEHPDWDEYRQAMVSEGRLLVRLPLTRAYGWVPDGS